jgi:hypothetical protein
MTALLRAPRRRNAGEAGEGGEIGSGAVPITLAIARYPTLAAVAQASSVLLVGGVTQTSTVDRVQRELSLCLEWIPVIGQNPAARRNVIGRIKRGKVGAVIVLEGLVGHSLSGPVLRACKTTDTPFAYGGRAGSEQLHAAFRSLEESLLVLLRAR